MFNQSINQISNVDKNYFHYSWFHLWHMTLLLPQDGDTLSRIQQALQQLQNEVERLSDTTQQLMDDSVNKQKRIDVRRAKLLWKRIDQFEH